MEPKMTNEMCLLDFGTVHQNYFNSQNADTADYLNIYDRSDINI